MAILGLDDPTGCSLTSINCNAYVICCKVVMPAGGGTITDFYWRGEMGTGKKMKGKVYSDNAGVAEDLLHETAEYTSDLSTEKDHHIASGLSWVLTAGTYWLGFHADATGKYVQKTLTNYEHYDGSVYPANPDPIVGGTIRSRQNVIWCVYTAAAPPVTGVGLSSAAFIAVGLGSWIKKQEEDKKKNSAILEALAQQIGFKTLKYFKDVENVLKEVEA